MTEKIYSKMVPLHLLKQVQVQGKEYLIQPIISKDGVKIVIPINHEQGGVECVTDISKILDVNNYQCPHCNKKIQFAQFYFDLSLHQILSEVWNNDQLAHTKCIKVLKDGSWEVLTEDYKDVKAIEEQQSLVLVQVHNEFKKLEGRLADLANFNKRDGSSIYQDVTLITQVKKICYQNIDLRDLKFDELNIFITRRTDMNQLRGFEMYYTAKNKRELVNIGLLAKNQDRDQIRSTVFHEESRVFYTKDSVILIGIEKEQQKDLGSNKVYIAHIKDFINDSRFWPDNKFLVFTELANLLNPRYQFQMAEYNQQLYVMGGWRKDPGNDTHAQAVYQVERLDYKKEDAKWEYETSLPLGWHDFQSCVSGDFLVLTGGVYIVSQPGICSYRSPEKKTNVYNLKLRIWEQRDNVFVEDNVSPLVIPSLKDQDVFYATGGLGVYQEHRFKFEQKKEIYQYQVNSKTNTKMQFTFDLIDSYCSCPKQPCQIPAQHFLIDNCAINNDLYNKDYLYSLTNYFKKFNNNIDIEAMLITNYAPRQIRQNIFYGAKVLAMKVGQSGKFAEIKIMPNN